MKYVDGSNVLLLTFNTHTPVSGRDIEHDLRLYDLVGAPIVYDEVSVEMHTRDNTQGVTLPGQTLVEKDTVPMLATNESKLTVAYPVPGCYSLRVVFRADGRDISAGEFAVDVVEGSAGSSGGFPWVRLTLTLVLGLFIRTLLPRRGEAHEASPREVAEDDEIADDQLVALELRCSPRRDSFARGSARRQGWCLDATHVRSRCTGSAGS